MSGREDKRIVREGSNRGAGDYAAVELYAMLAADGSADARAYVERYIVAKERLDGERRCRKMSGHYAVGFAQCKRRRWHRGAHEFDEVFET